MADISVRHENVTEVYTLQVNHNAAFKTVCFEDDYGKATTK